MRFGTILYLTVVVERWMAHRLGCAFYNENDGGKQLCRSFAKTYFLSQKPFFCRLQLWFFVLLRSMYYTFRGNKSKGWLYVAEKSYQDVSIGGRNT